LVLLAQAEELRADHVHDVLVLFARVHCVTRWESVIHRSAAELW
jgi:hypothetical protein